MYAAKVGAVISVISLRPRLLICIAGSARLQAASSEGNRRDNEHANKCIQCSRNCTTVSSNHAQADIIDGGCTSNSLAPPQLPSVVLTRTPLRPPSLNTSTTRLFFFILTRCTQHLGYSPCICWLVKPSWTKLGTRDVYLSESV